MISLPLLLPLASFPSSSFFFLLFFTSCHHAAVRKMSHISRGACFPPRLHREPGGDITPAIFIFRPRPHLSTEALTENVNPSLDLKIKVRQDIKPMTLCIIFCVCVYILQIETIIIIIIINARGLFYSQSM